jgi:phage terminase large subunit-like protein
MIDVPQNVLNFSESMKQLDALTIAGRIHHNGDPVLAWAIGNVVAKKDAKENVYPRKTRADNKIDPAVALIANLSLQLRLKAEPEWDFRVGNRRRRSITRAGARGGNGLAAAVRGPRF